MGQETFIWGAKLKGAPKSSVIKINAIFRQYFQNETHKLRCESRPLVFVNTGSPALETGYVELLVQCMTFSNRCPSGESWLSGVC